MRLTPGKTFWLGAGLILLCNALALAGVFYNRSGEPDSRLSLTERELRLPYRGMLKAEDSSGLALSLDWSQAEGWLTEAKLRLLGFNTDALLGDRSAIRWRAAWLVLELDGPAYQATVQRARAVLAAAEQAAQARPGDSQLQKARAEAGTALEHQLLKDSRLLLVDADLDKQVLRARYPDRLRYALVRGRLKPYQRCCRGEDALAGFKAQVDLDVEQINVPHALRAAFPGGRKHFGYGLDKPQAWVEIAFGQRHEPWMLSARRP